MILEAMKMEHTIRAPADGMVRAIPATLSSEIPTVRVRHRVCHSIHVMLSLCCGSGHFVDVREA
jgi:biotin-dependent enzyme